MTKTFDDLRGEEYLDSCDLIARLDELRTTAADHTDDPDLPDLDEDEKQELYALESINNEGESSFEDWMYGTTLIREDRFIDYAEEYASDIGAIDRDANWPLAHIDWKAAADELQQDYSSIDIDGIEYLGR